MTLNLLNKVKNQSSLPRSKSLGLRHATRLAVVPLDSFNDLLHNHFRRVTL